MMLWMAMSTAFAATPTPDRPYISRIAFLVENLTLEQELGVIALEGGSGVPATLKYAFGKRIETRFSANLGAVGGSGSPGLQAAAKLGLIQQKRWAFSLWAASGIPLSDEIWTGEFHALWSTALGKSPLRLRLDGGVDFVGDGDGIAYDGSPVNAALTWKVVKRVRVFGEVAGRAAAPECSELSCAYGRMTLNGGAQVALTQHLAIDAAGGYRIFDEEPYVTAGFTANFGRFE